MTVALHDRRFLSLLTGAGAGGPYGHANRPGETLLDTAALPRGDHFFTGTDGR
ncbi:hypothetical protein [Azospirillum sp. B4]|uniref:hypothetical protein n=1 Tax=Azospirillum sp. B4 TaxID=95605 RepID=UPI00034D4452|nr:hypothetical protein [Azospirillum sp. B4]